MGEEKAPLSKGAVRVSGLGDSDGPPGRMALPECGPESLRPRRLGHLFPPLALRATSPGAGESVFDKGGFYRYLSIRHASRAFVISPWIRVDTRSMRAAGSSFMPVRTHSSVRPTKAYL